MRQDLVFVEGFEEVKVCIKFLVFAYFIKRAHIHPVKTLFQPADPKEYPHKAHTLVKYMK